MGTFLPLLLLLLLLGSAGPTAPAPRQAPRESAQGQRQLPPGAEEEGLQAAVLPPPSPTGDRALSIRAAFGGESCLRAQGGGEEEGMESSVVEGRLECE